MGRDIAALCYEYPCRLYWHAKLNKDISIVIADVVEANAVPNNEVIH